jgi:hypothetical protein
MIHIDPVTRQRVVYDQYSGDLHFDLIGGSSISTQVISKTGISRSQQMNLGRSNALFGTDPGIQGVRLPDLGITGENIQTTQRKRIRRIIKVDGNN